MAARLEWNLLLNNTMRGDDLTERLRHGERSVNLAREHGLREQLAFSLTDIWFAYASTGRWQDAQAALEEAQILARDLGNAQLQSEGLTRLSMTRWVVGDFEAAIAYAAEGLERARAGNSIDQQALSQAFIISLWMDRGDFDTAVEAAETAIAQAATTSNITVLIGTRADLALAYGEMGRLEPGIELAQAALETASKSFPPMAPWPAAILVRLHIMADDLRQANEQLDQLPDLQSLRMQFGYITPPWVLAMLATAELRLAEGNLEAALTVTDEVLLPALTSGGVRYRLPDGHLLRGLALLRLGRLDEAREALKEGQAHAQAMGALLPLSKILRALAAVETRAGRQDAALDYGQRAQQLAQDIAGRVPAAWREAFWQRQKAIVV